MFIIKVEKNHINKATIINVNINLIQNIKFFGLLFPITYLADIYGKSIRIKYEKTPVVVSNVFEFPLIAKPI